MRARALHGLLLGALLVLGSGCRADPPAALLDVVTFAPSEADLGDRLEVLGNALPGGRTATLTFRGELHRPGRGPRRVEVTAEAVGSQRRITATLTEALQAEFCGSGHEAVHATFRGDVIAAFAPKRSSAPPVTGIVHGVVFDIEPPTPSSKIATERDREGQRALEFLGIRPLAPDARGKLTIAELTSGGIAERAGLAEGDVLLSIDGVNVRALSDVVPSSNRRFSRLTVQRGRLEEPVERLVDFSGFRPTAPTELSYAALLVGLAVTIVLLFMLPFARLLTWAERRVALRLKSRGTSARGGQLRIMQLVSEALAVPPFTSGAPSRVLGYLILIGASATFTLIATGRPLYHADLDLAILLLLALILRVTLALGLGGWQRGGRWSLFAGFNSGLAAASLKLPLLLLIVAVVMMTGTLRSDDFVSLQGALPWRWLLLQGPTLLFAFILAIAAMIPELSRSSHELPEAEATATRGSKQDRVFDLVALSEWIDVLVSTGVCSVVFLGGWRLPLVTPAVQAQSPMLTLCGALLLMLKSWGLLLLVLCARWVFAQVPANMVLGLCWRRLIPFSFFCLALTIGWSEALERPLWRSLQAGLGQLLFGVVVFIFIHFALRVAQNLKSTGSQVNVNPWL
jgi:NADH-quinone oxidoreductase subunit H